MEVVIVLVVIGLVVLLAWPLLARRGRGRGPRDQDAVTGTGTEPPPRPDEPIPGSRPHRARHGKP